MPAAPSQSGSPIVALATAAELCSAPTRGREAERRAARLAARRAIAALAGREVHVTVQRTPGAAATIRARGRRDAALARIALSLTHCDDRAAAAAAPAASRIGIDLERADAVRPEHARYFLTDRERVARTLTLSELWALKEAAWKALALDGAVPFRDLELDVDGAGRLRAVSVCGRRLSASATLASPYAGYVLATVTVEDATC